MTSDTPPPRSRRKEPPDPSPGEVDNSSLKPSTKKARRLPLPTNPTKQHNVGNEVLSPVTGMPQPAPMDDPSPKSMPNDIPDPEPTADITFHGEFKHFQLQSEQRKKLQKELENSLGHNKKGKGGTINLKPNDAICSIEKTLQHLETNNDII